MAKKTKKEKIMAQYRRKMSLLNSLPQAKSFLGQAGTPPDLLSAATTRTYSLTTPVKPSPRPPTTSSLDGNDNYSYVAHDLARIAILTALAICAQLVLWYKLGR